MLLLVMLVMLARLVDATYEGKLLYMCVFVSVCYIMSLVDASRFLLELATSHLVAPAVEDLAVAGREDLQQELVQLQTAVVEVKVLELVARMQLEAQQQVNYFFGVNIDYYFSLR